MHRDRTLHFIHIKKNLRTGGMHRDRTGGAEQVHFCGTIEYVNGKSGIFFNMDMVYSGWEDIHGMSCF